MRRTLSFFACLALAAPFAAAQDLKPIPLPKPRSEGGMPLMQALKERKSTREFGPGTFSPEMLANLLWAAFGVNRPDGRRTAPTAVNKQEIDIYVATPDGVYLYDAKANVLQPVVSGDLRGATGKQPFVKDVAVNLVYVADMSRMGEIAEPQRVLYSAADTGFIAQNVYLFCASEGLATVVRAWVDQEVVAKAFKLRPEQRVILAQSVGYPKK